MEESTLLCAFEMLVERLGAIEAKQDGIIMSLREADEARDAAWVPGRIHCGHPVRIHKLCELPLTDSNVFVSVMLDWKDQRGLDSTGRHIGDGIHYLTHACIVVSFPGTTKRNPTGLADIMHKVSDALLAHGSSIDDVHGVTLGTGPLALLQLYVSLIEELYGSGDATSARACFKGLTRGVQSDVIMRAKSKTDVFAPWHNTMLTWACV